MKDKEKWTNEELTDKLFRHDETALRCLYEAYTDDLLNYFFVRYKTLGRDEISDIITDALIKMADHPEKFKPESSSLKTYLIKDINGDILNTLAKIKREKKKLPVVELSNKHGNIKEENKSETSGLKAKIQQFLKKVFTNELDYQLAWMMEIEKIKATREYVRVLQLDHLSFAEQKEEVKNYKDRIKKKLNRSGWKDFLQKLKQNV